MTSIFNELERAEQPRLGLKAIALKALGITKTVAKVWLCAAILTQCTSLSILSDKVVRLENRPTVAQFGQDKTLFTGTVISEEENQREFIKESLPLLYSISPFAPKDSSPECLADKKCAQAKSKGVEVRGVGNVPQVPAIASYMLSTNYQRPFLRSLERLKPRGFEQGASVLYRVDRVGPPKDLGNEQFQLYVTGSLFGFDVNQQPLLGVPDDKIVTIRRIDYSPVSEEVSNLHKVVNSIRARRYEIAQIEAVELNSQGEQKK